MINHNFFNWEADWMTGIQTIDTQHRGLLDIINKLLQLCMKNDVASMNEVENIQQKLVQYVDVHFKTEESLMNHFNIDFRHYKEHKNLHEDFVEQVQVMFNEIILNSEIDRVCEIAEFLIKWLAYHILNTDKSLVRQIHAIEELKKTPKEAYDLEIERIEATSEPLVKALRALFYIVSEKNKALKEANQELEKKILERTKALIEANEKLEAYSMYDELTGLPNRRFILFEIEKAINQWQRYQTHFSILFIDADKFKSVNDNFGHDYGDLVLKWLSGFFKNSIRKSDIACRLGGDEFVIICEHCDLKCAYTLAEKLSTNIKNYELDTLREVWNPSISIGVVEVNESNMTTKDILKRADEAMYISKKSDNHLPVKA